MGLAIGVILAVSRFFVCFVFILFISIGWIFVNNSIKEYTT